MKKFSFIMFGIYAIIIWYGWFLPRKPFQILEIEMDDIDTYATVELDTFVIENPSWVKPMFQQHSVTVTIYHAVPEQCDDSPDILADGTKIELAIAGTYRYCALSRDLLERWDGPYRYGDIVWLEGAGKFSGPWTVKDTMNKRFTNRMDLLVDVETKHYKFDVATIWKGI